MLTALALGWNTPDNLYDFGEAIHGQPKNIECSHDDFTFLRGIRHDGTRSYGVRCTNCNEIWQFKDGTEASTYVANIFTKEGNQQ